MEVAFLPNGLRREAEPVAKRTRKRFVRTVSGIQRDGQDVRCAVGQCAGRLGETAAAHVPRKGVSRDVGERSSHVVARHVGDARDVFERDLVSEMTFDIPERLADRIHRQSDSPQLSACISSRWPA